MPYNESDIRAKRVDPVIRSRGWTEELIRREETADRISPSGNLSGALKEDARFL